jgi:hypothetical protein
MFPPHVLKSVTPTRLLRRVTGDAYIESKDIHISIYTFQYLESTLQSYSYTRHRLLRGMIRYETFPTARKSGLDDANREGCFVL